MLAESDRLVGGEAAFLAIDETCLPKTGDRSVGVAPQYASSPGKTGNCRSLASVTLASVTLASREMPVMVGLRLFVPDAWTDDPGRMARARVPAPVCPRPCARARVPQDVCRRIGRSP